MKKDKGIFTSFSKYIITPITFSFLIETNPVFTTSASPLALSATVQASPSPAATTSQLSISTSTVYSSSSTSNSSLTLSVALDPSEDTTFTLSPIVRLRDMEQIKLLRERIELILRMIKTSMIASSSSSSFAFDSSPQQHSYLTFNPLLSLPFPLLLTNDYLHSLYLLLHTFIISHIVIFG